MRIAIIGAGIIGSAFARLLLLKKITSAEKLLIIEKDEERCNSLRSELGCYGSSSIFANISESDVIIFAVKPQDFQAISINLKGILKKETLVISIMAGISFATLQEAIGVEPQLIRAMPNIPMIIGQGVVPYYSATNLNQISNKKVKTVLSVCGESLPLANEDLIDAATAISGSGPAYVFYVIEAYTKAALSLGFSHEEAKLLIQHTISGSCALYKESIKEPSVLRSEVTSKGGTTEAAISELEHGDLSEIFQRAIAKAYSRAKELTK